MMKFTATASVLSLILAAGAVSAQTTLTGVTGLNDQIDDIERDVNKDMARGQDASRFGNPEFRQGLSGSASLGYSGQTGNTKSQEFSGGARLRYAQGQFVQTIGLAVNFADTAGVSTKEDVFAVYDANYYFNDSFYGFVLGRTQTNGLATLATENKADSFIGFGPGYRILNSEKVSWRVQAGVGYSYLEDGTGAKTQETGYIASSRLFYGFNENLFLTNDTDLINTKTSNRMNNDFGINVKMTDTLSTRISYLTEYNDSRAIRTDNKLGVSLVFGF